MGILFDLNMPWIFLVLSNKKYGQKQIYHDPRLFLLILVMADFHVGRNV